MSRCVLVKANRRAISVRPCVTGFTLIEIATVLLVIGAIAILAAPGFASLIVSQRASSAATDISIALTTARSEAAKRSVDVTLQQKTGGWKNGWQILDPTNVSRKVLDHDIVTGASITGSLTSVIYQASGRVSGSTKPTFAITLTSGSASAVRNVCVDLSGRPFIQLPSCP